MTRTIFAALAGVSLTAMATPAWAQATPPSQSTNAAPADAQAAQPDVPATDDIIVTAQRRAERVTDVPISITVANQAQLERQQVNTVSDLNRIAPSLEIQQAPGQNTGGGGAIRGIGTQTFSPGAVASVGIVVDQVSQGNANIADLFDVSRIEVLKGPQGTLFGLTTSAGVINITTNAPDPTKFSARLRTELSNDGTAGSQFGQQVVQGVINLPLASNAALRVAGVTNLRQGVDRNAYTGRLNDINRYGVRARLLWEPTSELTVNLIGDYSRGTQSGGGDFFSIIRAGGPGILPLPTPFPIPDPGIANELASCGITAKEGNRDFCTKQNIYARDYNYGASLQLEYDAGPLTLTSISAYRESISSGNGGNIFRADPFQLQITSGPAHTKLRLFTQEFRVSSPSHQTLEYTLGAFYSRQRAVQDASTFNINLSPFPGLTIPVVNSLGARASVLDESLAAFGQFTVHVTPAFRLIAGGRVTSAKLELNRTNFDAPAAPFSRQALSTTVFSYRLGAQYDLARDIMVYATASKGFKGGQIAIPSDPTLSPYVVRPERPMAYDAGLKATLFKSWVADLSIFYSDVKDFQAQQCTVNQTTASLSCVQTNISGVKSRGAEINFFGKISDGLSLNTGFIYSKTTYPNNFVGTDGSNIGNTQLAYAPKYKFTLSGEYEANVTSSLKGFLAADTVWKSRIRYEANSRIETTFRPHWTVGGRVGLRTEDDRYQLAVFVRNLFNVHEPVLLQSDFPFNGAANVGAIYGTQSFRQVGLSLDAKF